MKSDRSEYTVDLEPPGLFESLHTRLRDIMIYKGDWKNYDWEDYTCLPGRMSKPPTLPFVSAVLRAPALRTLVIDNLNVYPHELPLPLPGLEPHREVDREVITCTDCIDNVDLDVLTPGPGVRAQRPAHQGTARTCVASAGASHSARPHQSAHG